MGFAANRNGSLTRMTERLILLATGYLYSQVFSADIYSTVFKADPMSSASGQKYRQEILQPGGSR